MLLPVKLFLKHDPEIIKLRKLSWAQLYVQRLKSHIEEQSFDKYTGRIPDL